jgi:hypothetical protein
MGSFEFSALIRVMYKSCHLLQAYLVVYWTNTRHPFGSKMETSLPHIGSGGNGVSGQSGIHAVSTP